mmetsp:Transcript_50437/g.134056  ORF Transcript_50437/g.134056 Transcript_50437/m.134056 type:complete len:219 (-) Transcript_50437:2154-2810(-)
MQHEDIDQSRKASDPQRFGGESELGGVGRAIGPPSLSRPRPPRRRGSEAARWQRRLVHSLRCRCRYCPEGPTRQQQRRQRPPAGLARLRRSGTHARRPPPPPTPGGPLQQCRLRRCVAPELVQATVRRCAALADDPGGHVADHSALVCRRERSISSTPKIPRVFQEEEPPPLQVPAPLRGRGSACIFRRHLRKPPACSQWQTADETTHPRPDRKTLHN